MKRKFRGTFGEEFQIPGPQPLCFHHVFSLATDHECYAVPGLADNKKLGIRKNNMSLSGTAVRVIFEPVVEGVLELVTGQINAAKRPIKTIVLVGGFGQNAYLRDAIREKVKPSNVEVLQSPNR